MNALILEKLREIEQSENCRILHAVESGSRAWGFPSPDSDYDVRFIYVRPKDSYLKLNRVRDVIELPINDTLDINGWDLDKALRLLHKSNPTVFEWFASPIVYKTTAFAGQLQAMAPRYFSKAGGLWHYLHMAEGNYRKYLHTDTVRAKKYFYVLRPLLACRWILDEGSPPPMLFTELMQSQLPEHLRDTLHELLDLKMNAPEIKLIPRIESLNRYIEESFIDIRAQIEALPPETRPGWNELNDFFLAILEEQCPLESSRNKPYNTI